MQPTVFLSGEYVLHGSPALAPLSRDSEVTHKARLTTILCVCLLIHLIPGTFTILKQHVLSFLLEQKSVAALSTQVTLLEIKQSYVSRQLEAGTES